MNGAAVHVGLNGHLKNLGFRSECNAKPLLSCELSNDIIYYISIGSIVAMWRTDFRRERVKVGRPERRPPQYSRRKRQWFTQSESSGSGK